MLLLLLAFNFPLDFNLDMALPNEDISTSTKVLIMCLGNIMLLPKTICTKTVYQMRVE